MRTPLGRVLHFGSAHDGTGHFWLQRLTAAANVILVVGFVIVMIATVGRPYGNVVAILGSPFVAALFVLLVSSVAIHMRVGMQVIVEDYVHHEGLKFLALAANTFFAIAVAVVAIIAILKIAVGA
jgi:succinate dehydrogenase / fumarate reductase membrane anchor subunit